MISPVPSRFTVIAAIDQPANFARRQHALIHTSCTCFRAHSCESPKFVRRMSESPQQASTHSKFQKVQECAADMEKLLFQDSKQTNSKADCAGGFTSTRLMYSQMIVPSCQTCYWKSSMTCGPMVDKLHTLLCTLSPRSAHYQSMKHAAAAV